MLVTCQQMQEIEQAAFARGIRDADLMEEAGAGIAEVVQQFFPAPGTLVIFLGKGNNAGDALVAARFLLASGWQVFARFAGPISDLKKLPALHWKSLEAEEVPVLPNVSELSVIKGQIVCLDGLLGVGAKGAMKPELRALAAEMNALRHSLHAVTVAMDIPSGLNGDTGEVEEDAVYADITATVAHVKRGLLTDAALPYVGRLALVPLADLTALEEMDTSASLLEPGLLRSWLPHRNFDTHKGKAGRVGVIAGSRGYLGAAVLASEAVLRAGAGLVTLLVKEDIYPLVVSMVSPEVMVRQVQDYREVLEAKYNALAIGPGLGFESREEVMEIIAKATIPVVVDADGLTMLARAKMAPLDAAAGVRLLTPHPGEMDRLIEGQSDWSDLSRQDLAERFAATHPRHVLLLKGSRTVIAHHGEATLFNSTGHAGMATGGMGDVLTGVCASLMGQGIAAYRAAALGAWICGRAAELAALSMAAEAVLPSDVIQHLGAAMEELKTADCY